MTKSIFIDGAVGTTGLEIQERLSPRSEFNLVILDDDKRKNADARREALNDSDFAILCLPDAAVKDAAAMVTSDSTAIIDASSVHRVDPAWTYGFPELNAAQREKIAASKRVSNPGCYPTGFLALIAPLVRRGLLPADWPYTVNAVSGYSGGGKGLIEHFEAEGNIAFRTYGLAMGHKHVLEMQLYAGLSHAPLFAPSVVNAHRGMVVEVPLPLAAIKGAASADDLRAALAEHYAGENLVNVHEGDMPSELLIHQGADPAEGLTLYIAASADGSQVRAIAMLDNLCKGASGAAVQNLNIMAGLDEMAGLSV